MRKNWTSQGSSTDLNIFPMKPSWQKSITNLQGEISFFQNLLMQSFWKQIWDPCKSVIWPALFVCYLLEGKMLHDGDESLLGEHIVFKLDIEGPSTLGIPGSDSNWVQERESYFHNKFELLDTHIIRKLKSRDCFDRHVTLSISSPVIGTQYLKSRTLCFEKCFYQEFFWGLPGQDRTLKVEKSPPSSRIPGAVDISCIYEHLKS